ncbi:hypothetical protein [Mucilaginibacter psychrotolerans]|uniref:Uncharacterized protein n=1 Tax=Mucilaginibacter psychrotolerans TaxID=1524096 RepID=A0A4Y8S7G4_9SPHI|nr:hypothetical protein [Mucilaginibacter psychrotolerans]TFF34407.1 hypothetical protein E2R66_22290 [Mucilaginibacter psychrotolerans]
MSEQEKPKEKTSWGCLGMIALFFVLCYYFYNASDKNLTRIREEQHSARANDGTPYGKKKCPWCGGIGRVGYAGDSKAQVERTGMGLGNYCTTCVGTGYVDDKK